MWPGIWKDTSINTDLKWKNSSQFPLYFKQSLHKQGLHFAQNTSNCHAAFTEKENYRQEMFPSGVSSPVRQRISGVFFKNCPVQNCMKLLHVHQWERRNKELFPLEHQRMARGADGNDGFFWPGHYDWRVQREEWMYCHLYKAEDREALAHTANSCLENSIFHRITNVSPATKQTGIIWN